MGQGTESCRGYDHDYNPYEYGVSFGDWTQRDGSKINVSKMTVKHLHGARAVAKRSALNSTFSCDIELWESWVEIFDRELSNRDNRSREPVKVLDGAPKKPSKPRGAMVAMICHCGKEYSARQADLSRGWALSCSKRCASIRREYGKPAAKQKGVKS